MIRSKILSVILIVIRLALGGLFVFAGFTKLYGAGVSPNQSMIDFMASVNAFKILPQQLLEPAAWTLPWLEIIAGLLLIFGLWTRSAALTLTAVLGSFILVVRYALDSGNVDMDCGCFGGRDIFCSSKDGLTECHFWRNVGMAGFAVILLLTGAGRFSIDGLFCRRPDDDGGDDEYHAPPSRIVEGRPAGL